MDIISIVSFMVALVLSFVFIPKLRNLISETDLVCENYQGDLIPNAMGLGIVFAQLLTLGIVHFVFNLKDYIIYLYLLGFIFMGFLGFIDDAIGTDKYKGLRGHLGAFIRGELSTGNIKALLGGFIAFFISYHIADGFLELLLNTLFIALWTNFMNLFDLRPGRAGKVFIIMSIILMLLGLGGVYNYIIYSVFGIMAIYLKYDLKAKMMMGDTGSNALGWTLGFYGVLSLSVRGRVIILIGLIGLHVLTEKVSLTKLIKENKILNYIDMLGR